MNELTYPDKNEISPEHTAAIKDILARYYGGGCTLTQAFEQDQRICKATYYAYKKALPEDVAAIDREARKAALLEKSGKQIALEAEQLDQSIELQRQATEALRQAIPQLTAIAKGETREVEMAGKNGKAYTKTIPAYPRDIIAASKLLQEIARGGVLPEHYAANLSAAEIEEEKEAPDPLKLLSPARANFSRIEATTPDGTKITATVERDTEIVEAEVEENEVDHL